MDVRVIIPVRPLEEGKTRLAASLSPAERRALNQRFFMHVLDVCRAVLPADRCFVISRSADVLDQARARGVQAIVETGHGLNAALEQAARAASSDGQEAILALSTDLPLLSRDDLEAMIIAGERADMVIAPDSARTGTNALLMRRPGLVSYCYGSDSFSKHRAAALMSGLSIEIIERPGLSRDIDTPDDLADLKHAR